MKVQNIKHEMKHNGLERVLKKTPDNMNDRMVIGDIVLLKDVKQPKYSYYYLDKETQETKRNQNPIYDYDCENTGGEGKYGYYTTKNTRTIKDGRHIFHKNYKGDYPKFFARKYGGEAETYLSAHHRAELNHKDDFGEKNDKLYKEEKEKGLFVCWYWKRFWKEDKSDIQKFCDEHNLNIDELSIIKYKSYHLDETKFNGWHVALPVERYEDVIITSPINPPWYGIEIMKWGKQSQRVDTFIKICNDLSIESFQQIGFGNYGNNSIIWNYPTNPFW